MSNNTQHAGRRRSIIAVAASVVLALVGGLVLFLGLPSADGPPQPPADDQPLSAAGPTPTAPDSPAPTAAPEPEKATDLGPILNGSPPVSIDIPSIAVRTRNFVDLGRAKDGSLEVPTDYASVGWYTQGVSPGQLGPAILAGHVDGHNGPAIFYRLGALRPGAQIKVARKDGSTATFKVDRIQRFRKDSFPTVLVYGSTSRSELRLITCGGSFDKKTGHYVDNVVAFAHLVA